MLTNRTLLFSKRFKRSLLLLSWLLVSNALVFSNTIVDAAGVYSAVDIDRIGLKIAEVETFHNIEIDIVTCTSALPQVGYVVSSSGLTGRKLLINIPAGVDVAGMQASSALAELFPVSSLERISEHVLRPLVGSRDYCLATLETLEALLVVTIELESLFFEKSVEIENILPSDAEWTFNNNVIESKLVAFPYQDKMKIRPVFNTGAIANGTSVKVIAQFGGNTVDKLGTISAGKIAFTNDTFEIASPVSSVDIVDEFKIDWFIELPNKPAAKIITTTSKIFFTLSKRIEPGVSYVGAFNYTCKYAKGATNETEFIDLAWKNFSTRRLRTSMFFNPEDNVEDVPLTYYAFPDSGVTGCIIAFRPDVNRDGECGAFMQLFQVMLETHGVMAPRLTVSSKTPREFFLVKNWKFIDPPTYDPSATSYPYLNFVGLDLPDGVPDLDSNIYVLHSRIRGENNQYTFYEETYSIDVSDEDGLPGQNVTNPYSDFFSHYLLLVNGKIYDPSYGEIYSSLEEFEEMAVEGFGKVGSIQVPGEERLFVIQLRKNKYGETELDDGQ